MTSSLKVRILTLLFAVTVSFASLAQEGDAEQDISKPQLTSMEVHWWSYFEGPREDVELKVNEFLPELATEVASLQPSNEEAGLGVLAAVRDNFAAYIALLGAEEPKPQELSEALDSYTFDDLLGIAAAARVAFKAAADEEIEVDREQRVLSAASRRRDQAFKEYVAAAAGDEKVLSGLRLMRTRSAEATSRLRLRLLTQSHDRAATYAQSISERIAYALENLAEPDGEAVLEVIAEQLAESEAAVAAARESLRTAELEASGLDIETQQGRSEQRHLQQKLVDAEVAAATAEIVLAQSQARRWWAELHLNVDPDLGDMRDQELAWADLIRRVKLEVPEWREDSQDELLALQTMDRGGLNRASRALLDQRLSTAQATLAHVNSLEEGVNNLELLGRAVTAASLEHTGAVSSFLRAAGLQLESAFHRVRGLADVTLFRLFEAPVTGRDILRLFIIMFIAFLLSRGIRYFLKHVSEKDTRGNQASIYTLSRMTHYTIITIAFIAALSSIGLDFSNLALVAGALSVGIGFGLQSIVGNFVSGLIILFEHTLRVGDYVELDAGLTGTVKAINVRSTLINTNDNIDIVVPNSEFVTTRLTNWTLGERILRVRIPFGVAYGSDKELVRKAALEAVEEVSYTLTHMKRREPDVWLVEFGDSSLNFLLTVWVNRDGARRPLRTRANYLWALETKLNEYGIEIPFPQRDLHLRSGFPPEKAVEPPETALVTDEEKESAG